MELVKFLRENSERKTLFVKYDKNKNVNLLLDPIPIKYLPSEKNVLNSLIVTSIKGFNCSDSWKFVAHHFLDWVSHIQGVGFDHYYSPVAHTESFIIKIYIVALNRLAERILDSSNTFKNKNVPINETFSVISPPYYL